MLHALAASAHLQCRTFPVRVNYPHNCFSVSQHCTDSVTPLPTPNNLCMLLVVWQHDCRCVPFAAQQYFEDVLTSEDDPMPVKIQLVSMRAVLELMAVLLHQHILSTATCPIWQLEKHPPQHNQTHQGRRNESQQTERIKPWPHPSPDDWENKSTIACRVCIAIVWASRIQDRGAPAPLGTAELTEPDHILYLLWWLVAHLIVGQTMHSGPCLFCTAMFPSPCHI